ncbi:type II secretion system F family protein [Ferruginivarius sediminum]|uniref:Type II secretion system F family protein n=1 Tax=Ferruginivarius sediminum TaxID=2661937 RepID=A0A369TCP7_9PROT|nr:type II secretion system F family protein [Ferruginivarius sediminum]RDD63060.1 type II secretion system F family protein [Ferruginivarius sediminum]
MPRFSYRAVDSAGDIISGEMEVADRRALVQHLRKQGYMPLQAEPREGGARKGARKTKTRGRRGGDGRMDGEALVLFTRELATLLGAGLPLDRALSTIAQQTQTDAGASVAQGLLDRVRGGASLADALSERGEIFPNYYVGLVRAGEAGGSLNGVLEDLADTLERQRALAHEVRAALNYPILVLIAAGISIVILLVGVIPEFEPLFEDAGAALPFTAKAVLAVSQGFREYWWTLPVGALVVFVIAQRMRRSDAMRARLDDLALRLPVFGQVVRKSEAARFCRTLGTLLANGVDVVPALDMGIETVGNARMSRDLAAVSPQLRRGQGLAGPLEATGVFPALAVQLMQVGETSGQLSKMLMTVAGIYDEEVRRDTRKMVSLLVPVVTLVLGAVVATIIGAILSAILSTYDLPL